jgi:peroxiredoxin
VAAAGDARDPRSRSAGDPVRHDPAVPDVLGDLCRRAEGAPRRDRGGLPGRRRGTADGGLSGRGPAIRSDIVPGGIFPDYELPDHEKATRRLSELQGDDPLILTLARGLYCPKEHQQHLELAANYSKIAVAYTQIATIATDDDHELKEFRASVGAQWTFLADPGRIVQKDLEIQEYTDTEHDPMIPHTLVLKPGLVIHSIYNGYWFWGRPSFVDLWRDLRAVGSEIRPDWDLGAPGLREAWDTEDRSLFHGWE